MAIHLSFGALKTRSGLQPVPRYESSTYQPITDDITTALSGPVIGVGIVQRCSAWQT